MVYPQRNYFGHVNRIDPKIYPQIVLHVKSIEAVTVEDHRWTI